VFSEPLPSNGHVRYNIIQNEPLDIILSLSVASGYAADKICVASIGSRNVRNRLFVGFEVLAVAVIKSYILCCYLLHANFLLCLFFDPEDGGNMFLQNISFPRPTRRHIPDDRTLHIICASSSLRHI
jgi:hypothetical protein